MCKKAVTLPSKSNYIQMSPLELKKNCVPTAISRRLLPAFARSWRNWTSQKRKRLLISKRKQARSNTPLFNLKRKNIELVKLFSFYFFIIVFKI